MRKDIKRQCEKALYKYGNGTASCAWEKIIKELLAELCIENMCKVRLVELKYVKKYSIEKTCDILPCAQTTLTIWREDILGRLAAKAAYIKLIKP